MRENNRSVRTAAQVVHDSAPALLYVPCDKQMRVIKVVLWEREGGGILGRTICAAVREAARERMKVRTVAQLKHALIDVLPEFGL